MTRNSALGMVSRGIRQCCLASFLLTLSSMAAMADPLDCSNVSNVVPSADISYSEGDSYLRYQLSYDQEGYHWEGTAYEFHSPTSDNSLLDGIEQAGAGDLTEVIAENYRKLLVESGVHAVLEASRQSSTKQGLVVTFDAVDESLPFTYGFHARRYGDSVQVFNVSGIDAGTETGSVPSNAQSVEAVTKLIKSCQLDET